MLCESHRSARAALRCCSKSLLASGPATAAKAAPAGQENLAAAAPAGSGRPVSAGALRVLRLFQAAPSQVVRFGRVAAAGPAAEWPDSPAWDWAFARAPR